MIREAAVLRVELRLGLVSTAEVVEWVDEQILRLDDPPSVLFDLSLMANANPTDVYSRLEEMSSGVPSVDVLPTVLGRTAGRLRAEPSLGPSLAHDLEAIYTEANYEVPPELAPIGSFADAYSLAQLGGYGTEEEAYRDLVSFVSRFEDAV